MTSLSGSGVGGNFGGPQQPSIFDLEQRGIQDTQRQRMAMSKEMDTLDIPLILVAGGNIWKYQSPPNRPVLAPLIQLRTNTAYDPVIDETLKPIYENLLNRLPSELQDALKRDQQRPFEDRNLDFIVLDNALNSLTKATALIDRAAVLPPPESIAGERMHVAQVFPQVAFNSAVSYNQDLTASLQTLLSQIGPNDPNYDTVQNALTNAQTFLTQLSLPNNLADVSSKIDQANKNFRRDLHDDSYQILDNSMDALSAISAALSQSTLAPSLFLAFTAANKGNADTELGIYTPSFNALIQNMSEGLSNALGWNGTTDSAKAKTLEFIIGSFGVFAIAGGAYLGKEGIGPFPNRSEADINEAKQFSVDVGLNLLLSSGLLESVAADFVKAAGVQGKDVTPVTSALTLWTLMLGIQSTEGKGKSQSDQLIESIQPQLLAHLNTVEEFLSNSQQVGNLNSQLSQGVSVYLSQAAITLQNHDYDGFKESVKEFLGLVEHTEEKTKEDISSIASFGTLVQSAFSDEATELGSSITGISQA